MTEQDAMEQIRFPGERNASDVPPADAPSRPLRVLHVSPGLGLGGAETLLYALTTLRSGFEHEVICLGGREWYSDRLEEHGIKVEHLAMRSVTSAARGLVRLRGLMREARPDVVQGWMYRGNLLGGLAARTLGLPVAWGIHASSLEPLRFGSRILAYLGGLLARWASDFVINCSTRSAEFHAPLGYAKAPGAVIHNGYDPEAFVPDEAARAATRQALGISSDTFLIGSVARWHPMKDIPNLLSATAKVIDRGVPVRCLLVGAELDATNRALAAAIAQHGCGMAALPLGRRSGIRDLARAMDLHVLASSGAEAFPNAVAETLLSGTPNVVTDVGDAGLMVGDTGWVVQPRDSEGLANAILQAWDESNARPDDWQRRRAAARQRIAERFTFERMAEAYEGVWRKLARRRTPEGDKSD